jgi:hypothetical protein
MSATGIKRFYVNKADLTPRGHATANLRARETGSGTYSQGDNHGDSPFRDPAINWLDILNGRPVLKRMIDWVQFILVLSVTR